VALWQRMQNKTLWLFDHSILLRFPFHAAVLAETRVPPVAFCNGDSSNRKTQYFGGANSWYMYTIDVCLSRRQFCLVNSTSQSEGSPDFARLSLALSIHPLHSLVGKFSESCFLLTLFSSLLSRVITPDFFLVLVKDGIEIPLMECILGNSLM
jgi:hypothetical protein